MSPNESPVPVLAIDGPSGSGKGTVSRLAAEHLGWHLLDSGALYRAVAYAASQAGLDLTDEAVIAACAATTDIRFFDLKDGSETRVYVNNLDSTDALRTEATGAVASTIAAMPAVRAALFDKQRAFRRAPGLVADGRDMGTVVFPDAATKVFLTASAEERAKRRYKQLSDKGLQVTLAALLHEIEARDQRDATRPVAPLRPAADAHVIDSTGMPVEAVVARVLTLLPPA